MPGFHFDQDLRDIPDSHKEWELFLSDLKQQLKTETEEDKKLQLLEFIGMASRTLIKLEDAEEYLLKAVNDSKNHSTQSRHIQNLIRLAHVYQWKKNFEESHRLFDQASSLLKDRSVSEALVAAYHQHLGKLFFDQQMFERAEKEFGTALEIRERISAPIDQIESSRISLNEAQRRKGG